MSNQNFFEIRTPEFHAVAGPALAKAGVDREKIYDAMNRGTKAQALECRNDVKRAINSIADVAKKAMEVGDDKSADHAFKQTDALGKIIAGLDERLAGINFGEQMRADNRPAGDMKVLRNAADYKAHYTKETPSNDERFSLVEWLRGVANMQPTEAVRNALTIGTDTSGGFAVPSIVMPQILEALAPASSLIQAGVGIVPMDIGAKTQNYPAINALPVAAWRNEGGAVAESDPTFRNVPVTPRSLAFRFKVSRELLADSIGMNDALARVIAQAFAKELDRAGLRGTGTAPEPRGLLNTSGVQPVANGANGAALANYSNFFTAAQAILQADAPMPTAAIMSPRSLVKLGGLLDSTGQPLTVPPMLQNMRMVATSQVPNNLTVGTSTDCSEIFIGDYSRMLMVLRENVTIQLLNELHATTGEIGFVGHVRADFAVQYPQAFAVVTGVRP